MKSSNFEGISGLMAALAVWPQTATPPVAADPVIKVSVDLVQIDAVATDAKGRRVTDLTPGDFEVREDGKLQNITHFSYINAGKNSTVRGASGGLRPEPVRRVFVIVLNDFVPVYSTPDFIANMPPLTRARAVPRKFVDEQVQPEDLVSILETGAGNGVFQEFTGDKNKLHAIIAHIPPAGRPGPVGAVNDAIRLTLLSAIRGLRDMPGRKAILLATSGFGNPEAAGAVANMANEAGVAINVLDTRGLDPSGNTASMSREDLFGPTVRGEATGRVQVNPGAIARQTEARISGFGRAQSGSEFIAAETGGVFYHDTNDLQDALANALEDEGSYYLIGYQPHREDFDRKNRKPQFHTIEVRSKRKGLCVRSRRGFYGVERNSKPSKTEGEEMMAALMSPFNSGGIAVSTRAIYSAELDPKSGDHVPRLHRSSCSTERTCNSRISPTAGRRPL